MSTTTREDYYKYDNYDPPAPERLKGTQKAVEVEEDPDAWRMFAMCKGIIGEDSPFYQHGFERKDQKLERETRAKSICGQCAVKLACLNYALVNREQHGIWGGATVDERKVVLVTKRQRSK